jgi:hypothetical protein
LPYRGILGRAAIADASRIQQRKVSEMFLFRQQARRLLAVGLSSCLALASVGPSVAVACEGSGEEQRISITNFAWSGGGRCPEEARKVVFTALRQWCEYEVKNANAAEEVKITELGQRFSAACEERGVLCLGFKLPANEPECKRNLRLAAKGGKCYSRLEYIKEATESTQMGFFVATLSAPGNLEVQTEARQLVE